MRDATETIEIGGKKFTVSLPPSYSREPASRRFPCLLVLTPGLKADTAVASLHAEGVLPEMLVAEITESDPAAPIINPVAMMTELAERFRLLDTPVARWIGGTGHDAITALRGILDHPEIFGAALCLSTSFEGVEGAPPPHSPMLLNLETKTTLPTGVRLYLDYGTVGLDECYEPYHRDLGAILREKGWKEGREFQINRHPGGSQDIASWQQRIIPALRWLAKR
jgi:hypothetical protein